MQYFEGDGKMRYYDSPAWGEWCRRVYGIDLKQIGAVTQDELALLFHAVRLSPDSRILDIGSGPGHMTAAVSEHYSSAVTGIDIDESAIIHAKVTFSDRPLLSFEIADGNTLSFAESYFDMICFFDTLYFTGTAENLGRLLDKSLLMLKPGGILAIYWSRNPMDTAQESENTLVASWGAENRVACRIFDLTDSNKAFWRKAMAEIHAMEAELREEIPETYQQVLQECIHADINAESLRRWLFVFTKALA
jgi:SAM-dependent methyltransferase